MTHLDIYVHASREYFAELGIKYKRTRSRTIVLPMGAFINAIKHKIGVTDIGRIFEIHHSTVLYHQGVHADRMMYKDYRDLFETACKHADQAVATARRANNAIHLANESDQKILSLVHEESWIAVDLLVEKLAEDFGIKIVNGGALSHDVDDMAKLLCNTLLRHIEIEET
jgi:hypothetical protein